jgi:hypothetical protein
MPMGALTVHYMARTLGGGATPWSARYTTYHLIMRCI